MWNLVLIGSQNISVFGHGFGHGNWNLTTKKKIWEGISISLLTGVAEIIKEFNNHASPWISHNQNKNSWEIVLIKDAVNYKICQNKYYCFENNVTSFYLRNHPH